MEANPLQFSDTLGLAPWQEYKDIDSAGIQAIRNINRKSIKEDREYGGRICRTRNGKCVYTPPETGNTAALKKIPDPCPSNIKDIVWYRTNGANRNGYRNEVFSGSDQEWSDKLNIPGYLAPPSGAIKKYTPIPDHLFGGVGSIIGGDAK